MDSKKNMPGGTEKAKLKKERQWRMTWPNVPN